MTTSEDQPTGTKGQWQTPPKRGGIRVQRGITTGAATITIDPVDMTKAVVLSNSKASNGYVPISANINSSGGVTVKGYSAGFTNAAPSNGLFLGYGNDAGSNGPNKSASFPASINQSGNISSSDHHNFTVREFSARLTSETTLQCDGAVEWQVVEYL